MAFTVTRRAALSGISAAVLTGPAFALIGVVGLSSVRVVLTQFHLMREVRNRTDSFTTRFTAITSIFR